MPPSILRSEALVIWMFRIAMNAPIIAAITEIQTVALARLAGADVTTAVVTRRGVEEVESTRSDMASPLISSLASSLTSLLRSEQRHAGVRAKRRYADRHRLALARLNGRDHRHAGPEFDARCIQRDLDGDALHDLGEVAGRIVRRQQRELLAAGGRKAVDVAMHGLAREHVDIDVDGLAGLHVGELRLLEVGNHIGAARRHQ